MGQSHIGLEFSDRLWGNAEWCMLEKYIKLHGLLQKKMIRTQKWLGRVCGYTKK